MPRGDGTGPWWAQGRWNCRKGMGKGMGAGRGMGKGFAQMEGEYELNGLKCYAKNLKSELDQALKRIASMEKNITKK
ncbi:MAG: DUF5320 domain-containing protein [Candidatus Micrarchaeota archaeon]